MNCTECHEGVLNFIEEEKRRFDEFQAWRKKVRAEYLSAPCTQADCKVKEWLAASELILKGYTITAPVGYPKEHDGPYTIGPSS